MTQEPDFDHGPNLLFMFLLGLIPWGLLFLPMLTHVDKTGHWGNDVEFLESAGANLFLASTFFFLMPCWSAAAIVMAFGKWLGRTP